MLIILVCGTGIAFLFFIFLTCFDFVKHTSDIHFANISPARCNVWSITDIIIYIINQVILPFWLVPAYDLLEERRMIDVIITKFFPLCFKMTESFENLDIILRVWAKDKVQKKSCRGIEQVREAVTKKITPFLF